MVTSSPRLLGYARVRQWDRGVIVLLIVFFALLPSFVVTARLYATDSVQYYVYLRSLFFDGDLDFRNDYARFHELNPRSGIDRALLPRVDPTTGKLINVDPTTGKLINVAPVGSAILWTPFFLIAHAGVIIANALGANIAADGYSTPYIWAICFASATYGLLGLLLCYWITRRYVGTWAATAAALICWLASPLIFYMYISPPWSHTGGLFMAALLMWYWLRTRGDRTSGQWIVLGLIGGLLTTSREQLGLFLLIPAIEGVTHYWQRIRSREWGAVRRLITQHGIFLIVLVLALTPQLVTYWVLNGRIGPSTVVLEKLRLQVADRYANGVPGSAHFWDTLVDTIPSPITGRAFAHGAFVWTPIWLIGLMGLVLLWRRDRLLTVVLFAVFVAQTWLNGSFGTTWHLSGAFGFRRLIEVTPIFVLGLALLIDRIRMPRPVWGIAGALLIAWNIGLINQWTILGARDPQLRQGLVWNGMIERQLNLPLTAGEKIGQLLFDRCTLVENCGEQ